MGPGVAWPKSRCLGCEPAALATESFPVALPGSLACARRDPVGIGLGRKVVWSHPAYADKCVFARNDKEIVCASLAAK